MQFCRYFLIIIFCILLQACCFTLTSPHMCQELELGKLKFKEGEFKQAFCELLPVAVYGNAEAEYAVGYMYYYGYGVPRDCDSGMFWMTRSASQHYEPAICALQLIRCGPPPCIGCAPCYDGCDVAYLARGTHVYKDEMLPHGDEVLNAIHRPCGSPGNPCGLPSEHSPLMTQAPIALPPEHYVAPARVVPRSYAKPLFSPRPIPPRPYVKPSFAPGPIVPHPYVSPTHPLSENDNKDKNPFIAKLQKQTVLALNENSHSPSYSLQLFGAYQITDVEKVQEKLHLQNSSHIYHTQNKGKDWYILTVGKYTSVSEAKSGINELSSDARGLGPWVRKVG